MLAWALLLYLHNTYTLFLVRSLSVKPFFLDAISGKIVEEERKLRYLTPLYVYPPKIFISTVEGKLDRVVVDGEAHDIQTPMDVFDIIFETEELE